MFQARPRNQAAQAIIELAIAVPVLVMLLLGAFDAAVMISDKVVAGAATRQGARLAAEIGGQLTNPGVLTTTIDAAIVKNVVAVASAMNYSTLQYIYIYEPQQPDGDFHAGDNYNLYDPTGNSIHQGFPLSSRNQIPPGETAIGVRIEWAYNPPTGLPGFALNLNEHAVFRASPVLV